MVKVVEVLVVTAFYAQNQIHVVQKAFQVRFEWGEGNEVFKIEGLGEFVEANDDDDDDVGDDLINDIVNWLLITQLHLYKSPLELN